MSEVLMYRLLKNRDAILIDLEAKQVVDFLYQEDVLDCDQYESVCEKGPRRKKAELLLSYVERDSAAIQRMIEALEDSHQSHLAKILQRPLDNEAVLSKGISQRLQSEFDNSYPMTHIPCGYAVIINNAEFDTKKLSSREGSEIDVRNMKKLFKHLQFEVVVHRNKTADEIIHIVRHYEVDIDHNNFDCFVLFLMSHGTVDGVYGRDGSVASLDTIRSHLTADKCLSLANKPKLIFVQACRGGSPDQGFILTDSPAGTMVPRSHEHSSYATTYTPSSLNTNFHPDVQYIPKDSDIFIAYASTAYYAAVRHTVTGGWFVTQLFEVMRDYAEKEDLQSMMLRVTNLVSSKRSAKQCYMQCPETVGNLRKKVFFKPKKERLNF